MGASLVDDGDVLWDPADPPGEALHPATRQAQMQAITKRGNTKRERSFVGSMRVKFRQNRAELA